MQLTDKIRQVKIMLVVMAIIIAATSLVISNILVRDLKIEEQHKMEVWAEAMRSLNNADENTDLNLVLKVLDGNNTIPVIVMDENGEVQMLRNVEVESNNDNDSIQEIKTLATSWLANDKAIKINIESDYESENSSFINVCYDDSLMIKRLTLYPYVQLGVVLLFVVIAIFALMTSKKAEQNKVWVGLSKETAHQLGTPISSLMAWTEVLRETYPDDELIPEMDKDVKRLQLIADRFSKIGSLPEPVPTSLLDVLERVIEYMDRRTSRKVQIIRDFSKDQNIILQLNSSLFEWVIENLCKNAVDAMEGEGTITISMFETDDQAIIEITDTGKGIRKRNLKNVFRPGFTTKKRGWGLGLSLAKRIIEEYHHGDIFVKKSEINVGTTFRIEMPK